MRRRAFGPISGRCLPADAGCALNVPQQPAQPAQCYDLLFLFFVQDIAHADRDRKLSSMPMSWVWVLVAHLRLPLGGLRVDPRLELAA